MEATNETVFYRSEDAVITDKSAKIGAQSYPLAAITSAALVKRWANAAVGYAAIGVGLLILLLGYVVWSGFFLTPMLAGTVLLIVGIALVVLARGRYQVKLKSNDGDLATLKATSLAQAEQLISAINEARGRTA